MIIKEFHKTPYFKAYEINCKNIFSTNQMELNNPFTLTHCQIPAKHSSALHAHDDQEIFLITKGQGEISIFGETKSVNEGDAIFIKPNMSHTLKNISSTNDLLFISIAWLAPIAQEFSQEYLVFAAPPTPNGELHLGHLSGPYLAGDIFCRAQKLFNNHAHLVVGTDDHQCYIATKSQDLGESCEAIVKNNRRKIFSSLELFGADIDVKPSPLSDPKYQAHVQNFFTHLLENGAIEECVTKSVFCQSTNQFIFGANVSGKCPNCRAQTMGNGCENCGTYNDCADLIEPKSRFGSGIVTLKDQRKYYFMLSRFSSALKKKLSTIKMNSWLNKHLITMLEKPLPNVAVSQDFSWGIKVPNHPTQIIYEWLEMAAGYHYVESKLQKKNSVRRVYTFGFDNSFFYGLFIPSVFLAFDQIDYGPNVFLSNYFYLLDDQKFSTSRNHAIWASEFLHEVKPDLVRAYLCSSRPENFESSFSRERFYNFVAFQMQYKVEGTLQFLDQNYLNSHNIFARPNSIDSLQERFIKECQQLINAIEESLSESNFSVTLAFSHSLSLLQKIAFFAEKNRCKKNDSAPYFVFLCLHSWARIFHVFMPAYAKAIINSFSISHDTFELRNFETFPKTIEVSSFNANEIKLELRKYLERQ